MPGIREVAEQARVSTATVSRVLSGSKAVSEQSRTKVLDAANRVGYFAENRVMANIAVAYFGRPCFDSPFDTALWDGLSEAAAETQFNLVAINANRVRREGQSFTDAFRHAGVHAAIVRSVSSMTREANELLGEGFPCVVVADRESEGRVDRVYSDSRPTSVLAIQHLIDLGHTRIALGISDMIDSDHADRHDGYREGLENNGLKYDGRYVLQVPPKLEGGRQLLRHFMSMRKRPTAVFVADPMVAVGLMNEATRLGVDLPEQLSVVGFDDSKLRYMVHPAMSAVCQDAYMLGMQAFRMLLSPGDGPEPRKQVLPTWFDIQRSTGRPPEQPYRLLPDHSRIEDEEQA